MSVEMCQLIAIILLAVLLAIVCTLIWSLYHEQERPESQAARDQGDEPFSLLRQSWAERRQAEEEMAIKQAQKKLHEKKQCVKAIEQECIRLQKRCLSLQEECNKLREALRAAQAGSQETEARGDSLNAEAATPPPEPIATVPEVVVPPPDPPLEKPKGIQYVRKGAVYTDVAAAAEAPAEAPQPEVPPEPALPPFPPADWEAQDYPAIQEAPLPDSASQRLSLPDVLPPVSDAEPIEWAFADKRVGQAIVVSPEEAQAYDGRLFFIGDLHGDADALRAVAERTLGAGPETILVFLGDLFDRGENHLEAARLLIMLARQYPGRILWLAGNHDVAFRYDEVSGQFASSVDPADFKDWLNEHLAEDPGLLEEGRALARIIQNLPILLVLGDLWVSHGGVPQSDEVDNFTGFGALTQPMTEDCVWSRMRDMREKLPNRSHRGAEVGYENARRFFAKVFDVTGISLRHIVCAHQHEQRNGIAYLPFTRCFKRLSCQCIFTFHDRNRGVRPCYLAYRGDQIPQPFVFGEQP